MLDVVIKNGMIIDGGGTPWYKGDVGIKGNKIVDVSPTIKKNTIKVVDVSGLAIAPGFIDVHSHDDIYILTNPEMEIKLKQGVTSVVVGNCGIAPVPANIKYLELLRQYACPVVGGYDLPWDWQTYEQYVNRCYGVGKNTNLAFLAAHGAIRIAVRGFREGEATQSELALMKDLVKEAMEMGALGLSTGLIYAPGCYADVHELIELACVVKKYGGIYVTHMRSEGPNLLNAVKETVEVGHKSGLPVHISHLKAIAPSNWKYIEEALDIIKCARRKGIDVTCDMYPYIAGSTMIGAFIPPWILEGGNQQAVLRLNDDIVRRKALEELKKPGSNWDNVALDIGWDNLVVASTYSTKNKSLEGKNIQEISIEWETSPADVILDLFCEEKGQVLMVNFFMSEEIICKILREEFTIVGSDGLPISGGKPHPRLYGTFPRLLGKYVREENVLSIERAIQKITSFPATRFGLNGRGYIKPGMYADITIFDLQRIRDKATYFAPRKFPEGINHVFVNGQHVLENGLLKSVGQGKLLLGKGQGT